MHMKPTDYLKTVHAWMPTWSPAYIVEKPIKKPCAESQAQWRKKRAVSIGEKHAR